jgi:WD40 repeat protein
MRSPSVAVLNAVDAPAQTVAPERVFHTDSRMIRVSFSHDGNAVVGASQDGNSRVWDVRSGALLRTVQWTPDFPFGVTIAPGGDVWPRESDPRWSRYGTSRAARFSTN